MEKKRGFTLIELIVTIAIIGILAAILIPSFSHFQVKARERACIANRTNLMRYYAAVLTAEQEAPSEENFAAALELQKTTCPDGGTIRYDFERNQIQCSVHSGSMYGEINFKKQPKESAETVWTSFQDFLNLYDRQIPNFGSYVSFSTDASYYSDDLKNKTDAQLSNQQKKALFLHEYAAYMQQTGLMESTADLSNNKVFFYKENGVTKVDGVYIETKSGADKVIVFNDATVIEGKHYNEYYQNGRLVKPQP